MTIKLKLEERLQALYEALRDSEAQTWAIRGAIQEVETVILPMLDEAENDTNDSDQGDE